MLQRYDNNGLELVIDDSTGEVFATIRGYARMVNKNESSIRSRLGARDDELKTAEIPTNKGIQGARLIPESLITEWIVKDDPELATQMLRAGVRVYLYGIAGYEIKPTPKESPKQQEIVLPPVDIRIHNLKNSLEFFGIDATNPRLKQHLQDIVVDKIIMESTAIVNKEDIWLGVVEKAERLGYSPTVVSKYRSSLGKWVAKHSDELDHKTEFRICNGTQREIKVYRDSETLAELIKEYMDVKVLSN